MAWPMPDERVRPRRRRTLGAKAYGWRCATGRFPPSLLVHPNPFSLPRLRGSFGAEDQLRTLPADLNFATPGIAGSASTWKHVVCPNCGGEAERETDTLDR